MVYPKKDISKERTGNRQQFSHFPFGFEKREKTDKSKALEHLKNNRPVKASKLKKHVNHHNKAVADLRKEGHRIVMVDGNYIRMK